MSRDPYSSGSGVVGPGGGTRSPRSGRRVGELPTVDRSPSRSYASGRGSPLGRKRGTRSGNNSPEHLGFGSYHHHQLGSPYYSRDEDLASPVMLEERGRSMSTGGGGGGHHRSRSASRPAMSSSAGMSARYTSLDRASAGILDHDREFVPIRDPRERSRDRGLYLEDELYGSRSARQSPNTHMLRDSGGYIGELQHQNNDLQRELGNLKKELELTNQKLGSSMHSIKTFWSPELKKERALRKEESSKYSLINEQLKLLSSENQKQSMMVRQLEEELRMRMRGPSVEMQQQMEVLYNENEHLTREIAILRDTIKELELRIETQKQTLQARDESIKKLLEMLQNKGMGKEEERIMFQQMQSMAQKQLDELRTEVQRRDQELLAMSAKMKTLEEQHQDYQRHITVLKESLCAKEEHYNMLQADVEEMRQRLEEKNRMIEKKTQAAMQAQQERNRMNTELTELKDHMDIKDRKINVLQRKVDLHEANKKLQAGAAKAGIDTTQERRQLEEQRRQVEEQRKQMEERAKSVDQKARTIEEKERTLQGLDQDLKKRKAKMDQLEQQLQRSGGSPDKRLAEMQKALENSEKELEKAKEESTRSSAETERLLHLMQMTQEEQNAKERQIRELQDALKAAQAKLKQAATAQQQEPETSGTALQNAREREESKKIELETKDRRISELEVKASSLEKLLKEQFACSKKMKDAKNFSLEDNESWKKELELKNQKIAELKDQLAVCKSVKNSDNECTQNLKLVDELTQEKESWRKEMEVKNERISQLEDEIKTLKCSTRVESKKCKDNEPKVQDNDETWKLEIETKNRRIVELEQEMESLENFLREHADTESVRDLEVVIERKSRRIEELEDTVAEFEDFLKQNPDVKELHDLRCQVTAGNRRIQELERWIQKNGENRESRINQERVVELEEMVTQLEEYVRKHNVDVLKRKLQDRECRIDQLQSRVGYLEKELLKVEEKHRGKETQKDHEEEGATMKPDDPPCAQVIQCAEVLETEQKMRKMELAIFEKDNKVQECEQQIVENKEEITKLEKQVATLKKELSEYDDIGVLKEEIRVRDERIQQLEDEVDSLERAFSERIDLEQIEELVNVIKEKEDKERQFSKELMEKRNRIEELSEALRESVVITSDSERKLQNEERMKKEALQRIAKLEQRIASMQSASALKCITCQPLLSKLHKYEKKLRSFTEERTMQLEDLRQMKREALKAAVSEKDAHLALLELSGLKTVAQSEQADQLKADKKRLLEKLKKEDEESIELSVESSPFCSEGTLQLLTKVLETSDDDEEETSNDRRSDSNSPRPATTNGDSCADSKKTSKELESRSKRELAGKSHQQDSR